MTSRALKTHRTNGASARGLVIAAAAAVLVLFFMVATAIVLALCSYWLQDLPDYRNSDAYEPAEPTRVYASDGETLLAEFQLEWRDPVSLDQISPLLIDATIAIEDERFYAHPGVDLFGIVRALANNLLGGELEGASTITQQFVRNTVLADEMGDISLKRKVREAYIALQLEKAYTKDEILSMYLNTINYGQGAYGIEAASLRYFSKHALDLTLDEAATLAGIPQSPTYNNPIADPDRSLARRDRVLDRMAETGYLTQAECDEAKALPIELDPTPPSTTGIVAYPYFTSYVRNQLLNEETGHGFSVADIFEGGLTVITTLDAEMQKAAQSAADARLEGLSSAFEVSLVAIDPENGYIKALVGGKDYEETQVNMATGEGGAGRQAGSAFKTFTLLAALEAGINPSTTIDAGSTAQLPGWTVSNIDKRDYGTRTIASAYQVSSNTAFARLAMSVGIDKVVDMAHRLGITSALGTTGSVTLGVDSVTPLEMADAYAAIANGGVHYSPECVITVMNRDEEVLVDNADPQGERVLSPEVSHAAIEIMQGVITQGTGQAAALSVDQPVAGKTGTSDKYKDSWFCGFTPQLSVAIWLGDRSDYSSALSVPVGVAAASVFADFMDHALANEPRAEFIQAGVPDYLSYYADAQYHIGGYYGSKPGEDE
ncbi:MAG: transglycosylase domain-containing protein, partial [Eggerthellaceae bacterium]|nr:transglycosylase domain-containing protein [Eggerthellaceae bacterium]